MCVPEHEPIPLVYKLHWLLPVLLELSVSDYLPLKARLYDPVSLLNYLSPTKLFVFLSNIRSSLCKFALVASGVAGTKCNLHTNSTHVIPCIDVY